MNSASISAGSLARLRRAELSTISHALRSPLTSIVGFAEAILNDPQLAMDQKENFTRIIKSEGEKLSKFVDELMETSFALQDPGSSDAWDLSAAISSAFHEVSPAAAGHSVTLRHEIPFSSFVSRLNREFVLRMLSNILINAVWNAPDNSDILVKAEETDTELRIHVRSGRKRMPDGFDPAHVGLDRTRHLLSMYGCTLSLEQSGPTETIMTLRLLRA